MITLLRKRRPATVGLGDPYERVAETTAQLEELIELPRDALLKRCALPKGDPQHVRSECLLYFVRSARGDNTEAYFDSLYRLLIGRVLKRLPRSDRSGGSAEAYGAGEIRDRMLHRFVTMVAEDHHAYCEKLDFFEIRFDSALAKLRIDAERKVGRDEKRFTGLAYDEETGEPSKEVEKAAGNHDPFRDAENASTDYRLGLDAAIDALPVEQIRIIEMLRLGIPIDSKEAYAVTIAKTLGRVEKTIRNQRDKAYDTLRRLMKEGGDR